MPSLSSIFSQGGSPRRPISSTFQPLATQESSALGNMYMAMAARVQEEEQVQRTMVALKETPPFYPGKTKEEVKMALDLVS